MSVFTYQVPVTYSPEDNETRIKKATILVKDCTAFANAFADCEGWNFNHCKNDDDYCQPFVPGDKLYLQIRIDTSQFYYAVTRFWDSTTDEVFDATPALLIQSGVDTNRNVYVNVVIDTGHALFEKITCFYMTTKLFRCAYRIQDDPATAAYNNCRAAKIAAGKTAQQAKDECYEELCDDYQEIVSEPYCKVRCDEPTVLVSGTYPKYDCNGNYYGPLSGVPSIHQCQVRVPGTIEQSDFDIQEVISGNKRRTSATLRRLYNLRTLKIPLYVAEKMALAFAAQNYYVDGIEYKGPVKFSKSFEEGRMWIVTAALTIECDENNFTCK